MGNQPSKKTESKKVKKNKLEKTKEENVKEQNEEVDSKINYLEIYPLLNLFSTSEKKSLKNLFLTLCDATLEIEKGKEILNHELEETIIKEGEIKEEKFI
eukprot:jgi/Orpsp1_1/1175102/evm.model.c7180000052602.1